MDAEKNLGRFVVDITTEHTGGNCMADVVRLASGALVVISDEGLSVFDNPADWGGEGEIENARTLYPVPDWFERNEKGLWAFVRCIDTDEPHGPVSTDLLTLHDGRVIGIDAGTLVIYPGMEWFENMPTMELGAVAQGAPGCELNAMEPH